MKLTLFILLFPLLAHSSIAPASEVVDRGGSPQDINAISDWCNKLGKELKSVEKNKCLAMNWKSEIKSPHGVAIPYLQWGSSQSPDAKKIMVLGAVHGDEIAAVSVVFRWIDFLERTKKDSFLRKNEYLFVPLVNPDGFYAQPRSRTNSNGVDINRNFATENWNEKATVYWKEKAKSDPRRFPGKVGASETETQFVQKWIEDFKPDLIISVHAPYCLVDYDGPIEFPKIKGPLPVRTLGAYPGSLGTYAGVERKIPVVTPELSSANQIKSKKHVEDLFLFIMKAKIDSRITKDANQGAATTTGSREDGTTTSNQPSKTAS
ncbi:MAG: M14 family zinc carboxypeptidase [Bacteriovoracia bacterium]